VPLPYRASFDLLYRQPFYRVIARSRRDAHCFPPLSFFGFEKPGLFSPYRASPFTGITRICPRTTITVNEKFGRTQSTRGIGYRLGGFLYWSCLVLAVAWAVLVALVVGGRGDLPRHWLFYLLVFFGPVVLLYGVGRAFRYILSEE
jgi:hypothetical protein